ncbi:MAG TPA: RnfABCDGE type electron transport complex subunit G [Clostridia bacterium]|nr:RnfABCDGE type electron transport complex subunit G [Clostridia bacterium]
MKEIMNLGFKLLLISLIAALSLGYVNGITADKIAEQRALANERARKAVSPEADSFNEIDVSELNQDLVVEGFEAISDDLVSGYVFKTIPKGYGGALEVIVGIDNDGTISGVRIGSHTETPGLGAKATDESFYSQYKNMSANQEIAVSKTEKSDTEIQAISGATITSVAVTKGVNSAIKAFEAYVQ